MKIKTLHKIPLLIALALLPATMALAQTAGVSGRVTDADTKEPVVGATVVITGTTTGVTTGTGGSYELRNVPAGASLTFRHIGYADEVVPVGTRTEINVGLKANAEDIDQVVVVGYGVVRKRDLTGSVASVKSDEVVRMSSASVTGALVGKVAGVQITNAGGGPGDGTNVVRIRGGNSISGSNDPLWVVDGFIAAGGAATTPPEDIESIEVLKDASATAIYGARGANGVILVTTKRAKSGQARSAKVTFRTYMGAEWMVRQQKLMNGPETYDYWNAFDPAYIDNRVDPQADFDWVGEATRNAMKQSYYASVEGGTKEYSYNVSAEYMYNQGVIRANSDLKRLNIRAAFDFNLSEKVKMGITARYRNTEENAVGNGSFYQMILRMSPLVSPYNTDGSYNYCLNPGNLDDANGVDIYSNNGKNIKGNPMQYLMERRTQGSGGMLSAQAYLNFTIARDFVFRTEGSFMRNNKWDRSYSPSTLDVMTPAKLAQNEGLAYEWVNTLTYKKVSGDHSINVVLGQTAQIDVNNSLSGGNLYFAADGYEWNNLSAGNPVELSDITVGSGYKKSTMLSFLARANYVYRDKYLFTVSGRADGSSKFAKNNKWAYFPSAAVSWRLGEERFVKSLGVFDNLKLRASVGVTGSEAISPYQSLGLLSSSTGFFSSTTKDPYGTTMKIYRAMDLANDNLSWESTTQWDLGLDMSLLGNRLHVTFDYYDKITRDLLLNVPLSPETGYDVKIANVGEISNRGFEVTLSGMPVSGRNFQWNASLNFSRNRNEVVSLGDATRIDRSTGDMPETIYLEVGRPVGVIYGWVTNGIWQTAEDIANYPSRSGDKPGDFRIMDTNRDGYIDSRDKVALGDPNPKFTFGVGNTLVYKNLELSFFFSGAYGGDVVNFNKHKLMVDDARDHDLVNYWTAENHSMTHTSPGNTNVGKMLDKHIEDGSFIKLRNVTLRYSLPRAWVRSMRLSSFTLFVTGTDLWTVTGYSGVNPEANLSAGSNTQLGIDYSTYPVSASLIGGLSFTF